MYILWVECSHNQLTSKESGTIQTLTDQKILSAQLQIIKMLDGPKFRCEYCKKQIQCLLSQRCECDLHILDMIALWLTTGQPGDDIAVAFDKNAAITLVLAKNRCPTREDNDTVRELIDAVAGASSIADIIPAVIARCHVKMQRRINKLHKQISKLVIVLEAIVAQSLDKGEIEEGFLTDGLIGEEFPFKSRPLSEEDRNIIAEIYHGSMIQLDPEVAPLISLKFVTLAEKSNQLLHSTVLLPRHFPGREQRFEVDELRRCVRGVSAYVKGAHILLKKARLYFPDGRIRYRWVDDSFSNSGEGVHDISEALCAAVNTRFTQDNIPDVLVPYVNPGAPVDLRTALHAELRLILDIDGASPPDRRSKPRAKAQAIGLSKATCLCCTRWIDAYNESFKTRWVVQCRFGRYDPTWAYPGHSRDYLPKNALNRITVDCQVYYSTYLHILHMAEYWRRRNLPNEEMVPVASGVIMM